MRLLIRKVDSLAPRETSAKTCRFNRVRVCEADGSPVLPDDQIVEAQGRFFAVIQKGRSFQRANPRARVLIDQGRFLLIDWTEAASWVEEPGCFAVVPYEPGAIDFSVQRGLPTQPRSDIVELVSSFSTEHLKRRVEALASIHTRHSTGSGFEEALDYSEEVLTAAGCTVSRQPFAMLGSASCNLIGYRRGTAANPRLFVIGAHLDSVNHEGDHTARAPGADDNASGSVTVMQAATSLARISTLAHDVIFLLFGGEEQGLFGSRYYVSQLTQQDRNRIGGVVNIDMAASKNTPHPSVLLEGHLSSQALIDQLASAAVTYTVLETQISLKPFASDHVPFIDKGIPAVLTIEGADGAYEHEHTARDVTSRLDFELHRQITMMDVAWLADQAIPQN